MNRRTVLLALGFGLLGAVLGYAINAGGPIPALVTLLFLFLLMRRSWSPPEQGGAFLLGLGLVGAVILGIVVVGCRSPSCHFEVITPITLVSFLILAALGVWLLTRAIRIGRFAAQ